MEDLGQARELVAYGDDLEDGEKDCRRRHYGWELQHGRDIGGHLGGGDHPVNRIATRAPSNGSERHESYELKRSFERLRTLQSTVINEELSISNYIITVTFMSERRMHQIKLVIKAGFDVQFRATKPSLLCRSSNEKGTSGKPGGHRESWPIR